MRKSTFLVQHDSRNLVAGSCDRFYSEREAQIHTKENAISNVITDETPIWLDMAISNTVTVNEPRTSSITIRSTGHKKYRVSVCL